MESVLKGGGQGLGWVWKQERRKELEVLHPHSLSTRPAHIQIKPLRCKERKI